MNVKSIRFSTSYHLLFSQHSQTSNQTKNPSDVSFHKAETFYCYFLKIELKK
ncbi:hypothetical protein DB44_EQ00030 [Candidatus Protochlamydia amoebophila]|uniref:Uncharacterized protein n=1 Tax=Candidatus Protochlamydia amoebophila TaxID=362787 RepID=A0A0C1JV66_9BACT|nr:hypothetical protein DB44_EQ00030 [Candidatus Protochlamydia amoebophila]